MTDTAPNFARLVPGFDFLQGLVKNAGSVLPNIGQWVAPTLNPEELEKRIEELRTVQFWLEQNARMLAATIQALEVQRMTLSTLKTMNVQVADLRESMRIKLPEADEGGGGASESSASWPMPGAGAAAENAPPTDERRDAAHSGRAKGTAAKGRTGATDGAAGVVDPMQWWGALTQQFTQLAAHAMKDAAADSARQLAGSLVKQGLNAAGQTVKASGASARKAAEAAGGVASPLARPASKAKTDPKNPSPAKKTTATRRAAARRR